MRPADLLHFSSQTLLRQRFRLLDRRPQVIDFNRPCIESGIIGRIY